MTREVPEWVGRTHNSAIPPRVKIRIFLLAEGKCQHCKRFIRGKLTAEYDHIVSLVNAGDHREENLQLLCSECHRQKSNLDVAEKSIIAHKRAKHIGAFAPRVKIQGQPFRKAAPQRTASRPLHRPGERQP